MSDRMRPALEARFWHAEADGRILCTLCPRACRLAEGQAGFCFIRQNQNGVLRSLGYGRPTGFAVDPIEKKPLNHFLPGSSILSFGTAGCNLGCRFCQNWDMTKASVDELHSLNVTAEHVVDLAQKEGCPSIAFTYNDPVIIGEFVIDVSHLARERGIRSVMVTAGYVTPEARREIFREIDAVNIDLKGFTEEFYKRFTLSQLQPVLDTMLWFRRETDIWFEITTLLIPGHNDGEDEIRRECGWLLDNLGEDVPLHFTAFHPDYKMTDVPATPAATLQRARTLALEQGIKFVYVGNVLDDNGQTTWCPNCGAALIQRDWHSVRSYRLRGDRCPDCSTVIPGRFDEVSRRSTSSPRRVRPDGAR